MYTAKVPTCCLHLARSHGQWLSRVMDTAESWLVSSWNAQLERKGMDLQLSRIQPETFFKWPSPTSSLASTAEASGTSRVSARWLILIGASLPPTTTVFIPFRHFSPPGLHIQGQVLFKFSSPVQPIQVLPARNFKAVVMFPFPSRCQATSIKLFELQALEPQVPQASTAYSTFEALVWSQAFCLSKMSTYFGLFLKNHFPNPSNVWLTCGIFDKFCVFYGVTDRREGRAGQELWVHLTTLPGLVHTTAPDGAARGDEKAIRYIP
ncbi:hypothetical protein B0H14DRAFT_2610608 [Mycena olivaceomarginata]|nr:hypothetical protein B0H14DRAFT_2610608 [Mycena olivaceomarginata]